MAKHKLSSSVNFYLIGMFAAGFFLFLNTVCYGVSSIDYLYLVPAKTTDGWETTSINNVGFDSKKIHELLNKIQKGTYKNIHSLLLVKGGKLILEEYFHGFHREKAHQIRSATKSIGSILLGIAIDQRFVRDENVKIFNFFKDYKPEKKRDERARKVTLKSLLTMTSGYDCDDHATPSFQCEEAMYKSNDWLEYALSLPMAYEPGKQWAYNSSSLIFVSEMISKTSKLTIPQFADRLLFTPLGIDKFRWGFSPKKRVWFAGNARMKPRNMAKIGYLMLNGGKWIGQQIISQKWINKSTKNHVKSITDIGYGYLWWTGEHLFGEQLIKAYWAAGNGGNYIFICPELDLVAVFTGGNYNSILEVQPLAMLTNYIIPALLPSIPFRRTNNIDPLILDSYVGVYEKGHLMISVSKKNDNLNFKILRKVIRLYSEKEDSFYAFDDVLGNMKLKFKKDDKGKITSVVINSIFRVMPFKKVK
jgi:CubicO group peptidase (beta-lactamase class C family)